MAERACIRFLHRGEVVEVSDFAPSTTLLDWLRLERRLTGTKEGCNEGDCGACTVVVGTLEDGRIVYEPVNACIQLLGMLDGKELVVVDDLAEKGELHPVQQALVDHHGSQCGFCTPGFVMALFALYHAERPRPPSRVEVTDWLAGNLCRCTGYRPIVDAALAACAEAPADRHSRQMAETARKLSALADSTSVFVGSDERFFAAPACREGLARLYARHPDAVLVAGATDVALWITKQLRELPRIIHLGRVAGFDDIAEDEAWLTIGAGATYRAAHAALARLDPDIGEVVRRLGSRQVRAAGTVGGNIANGSPIGDTPPMLMALGASIDLVSEGGSRTLALENFFLAYGRQDRKPGEFVSRIHIPRPKAVERVRCYKISKRFDQDISAVLAAFKVRLDGRRVAGARIAFGGMAATPRRAAKAEAALNGARLDDRASWEGALAALGEDFTPISDMRASAGYRLEVARALLVKAMTEIAGAPSREMRITGFREVGDERAA
jgi:xanthine dehydrogenase small subunit